MCCVGSVTYSYTRVTYSYTRVTYSYTRVTYSYTRLNYPTGKSGSTASFMSTLSFKTASASRRTSVGEVPKKMKWQVKPQWN